ncbi:MAG: DUF4058 family protein [Alkalinema sp. RU_4_3]|nr:DUF4058 family protein [Alkalinema sp. RU_4_3]
MDPYLEVSEFWSEVHSRLIVGIADALAPVLRPRYRVAVGKQRFRRHDF